MRLALICAALLATNPALAAEDVPASQVAAELEQLTAANDPARMAAAKIAVDHVWPVGTYARMMNGTMDQMMDSILNSTMDLPVRDLAAVGGADTGKLGSATMAQVMEIYDPAYKERLRITSRTMMGEMTTMMTQFEPDIREGLVSAYATKFDTRQLADLNAFFATPTGKAYAADAYLIMMSPEVMSKMQGIMPRLMRQMPAMLQKVQAATASLPRQRTYAELSDAEKGKLAQILGISRSDLDKEEAAKAAARASRNKQ